MEFCKIIIVEDELLMRQGIKNIVNWESEGFKIVGEAANGKEALELISWLHPHIVVTDIVMPVMDGIELTATLAERFPEIKVVVLSSYSDFNYVKPTLQNGAADYLLKPALSPENLLSTMQAAAAKISGFTLHRNHNSDNLSDSVQSILGKAAAGFSDENDYSFLSDFFKKDSFLLCNIFCSEPDKTALARSETEKNLEKFLAESKAIIFEHDRRLLLLVNYSSSYFQDVLDELKHLSAQIRSRITGVFIAAAAPFSKLTELHATFTAVIAAAEKYFYYPNDSFYLANNDEKTPERFDLQRFSSYLSMSQIWNAMDMFATFTINALNAKTMSKREIKSFIQSTLYQVFTVFGELPVNNTSLENLKRGYLTTIEQAKTADDLIDLVCVIVEDYLQIEAKYRPTAQSDTIVKIIDYINEHYAEPLSLGELAERFAFNYNYLSTYFSSHSAEGFSEYLNRLRIQHASELLLKSDMAINEICGVVGYTDHSYFTKVFKKSTGKTPREFRQQRSG